LEAAIRERVREIIEMVLQEEVEATLGARRSQRVAERVGYRQGGFEVRVLREGSSYDLIQVGSDLTPILQFSEESTQPRPLNNKQDGH
jgi:hypothetical protein